MITVDVHKRYSSSRLLSDKISWNYFWFAFSSKSYSFCSILIVPTKSDYNLAANLMAANLFCINNDGWSHFIVEWKMILWMQKVAKKKKIEMKKCNQAKSALHKWKSFRLYSWWEREKREDDERKDDKYNNNNINECPFVWIWFFLQSNLHE